MAVELATAYIALVPSMKGASAAIGRELGSVDTTAAGAEMGRKMGGGMLSSVKSIIAPAIALAGSAMFVSFIKDAAAASDATDKFKATMSFAGLDTSAITKASKAAKDYADQTVYDLPTIQNTTAQLASNGIRDYTGLTQAAGNLNAVAGGNADTFKSVAMVLTQTAGAGKLTTENWNQMADAIPGAAGPLMKALQDAGAYTGNFRDAMANGQITADEFNAALMKLGTQPVAVEAAKSTKTFEGAIGNLEATINSGLMTALDSMKPAITGTINLLSGGLGKAFDFVGKTIGDFTDGFTKGVDAVGSNQSALAHWGAATYMAFSSVHLAATVFFDGLKTGRNEVGDGSFLDRIGHAGNILHGVLVTLRGSVTAFFGAFKAGDGDITSSGLAGALEGIGGAARTFWDALRPIAAQLGPSLLSIITSLSPLRIVLTALAPVLPTLAVSLAQLAQAFSGVLAVALKAVAPVISAVLSTIGNLLNRITGSPEGVKVLSGAILVLTGAFTSYRVAVAAATASTALFAAAKAALTGAGTFSTILQGSLWFIGLARAQGIAAAAQWALNIAMDANPIGVVILAITAAIAAIAGIVIGIKAAYENIGWFKDAVNGAFAGIQAAAGDVVSWFQTSVGPGIAAAWNWIVSVWNNAVSFFAGIGAGIVSAFSGAASGVTAGWGGVVGFFQGIVSGVVGAWNGVAGFFAGIWAGVSAGVSAFVAQFMAGWNGLVVWLGPLIAVFRSMFNAFGAIFNFVAKLASFVGQAIMWAFGLWIANVTANLAAFGAFFSGVWNRIVGFTRAVMTAIQSVIVAIWNACIGAVTAALSAIWGVVSSIWNTVAGFIGAVLGRIGAAIAGAWNAFIGMVSGPLSAIWGVVSSVWNTVAGFIGGIVGQIGATISAGFSTAVAVAGSIFYGLLGRLQGAWGAVAGWMAGLGSQVIGFFGGAGSWLLNAGSQIIGGLLDGLRSMWDSVASFFNDLTSKIPSWKGPAERDKNLLTPAGSMIMDSLLGGLRSRYGDVRSDLSDFTDSLTDDMGARMANVARISGSAAKISPALLGSNSAAANRPGVTFTGPIHVRDENELARIMTNKQRDAQVVYGF